MRPEAASWSVAGAVPGLGELWAQTQGDPGIGIGVLDGPVDLYHPSLRGADLRQLETLVSSAVDGGPAARHGTHVASLIFGQPHSPLEGVAPRCRGVILPVFASAAGGGLEACSQVDLARALLQAVRQGVRLVNVSGGQLSPAGSAHPLLADAVRECGRQGILIVAAAGNEGCECFQVPAALEAVLAVGAMDGRGEPLASSNWGGAYQSQGILAPGQDLLGAQPGGGVARQSGTSFATALVTGVAALLLSLQRKRGREPDTRAVREALLQSAIGCAARPVPDCRRLLAGRLNVSGAVNYLFRGVSAMSETANVASGGPGPDLSTGPAGVSPKPDAPARGLQGPPLPADAVVPSGAAGGCACPGAAAPSLVFALGQIGFDFVNEARLDSFVQRLAGQAGAATAERVLAFDPRRLLTYLNANPFEAASLEWTLLLDGHPVYAIRPLGPFAADVYAVLRTFLNERLGDEIERVSISGVVAGKTRLLMGQTVPVIVPERRGMYSWRTRDLVEKVIGPDPVKRARETQAQFAERARTHEQLKGGIHQFLERVYHGARNLGASPQDRALNHAATNAFRLGQVYEDAIREGMELESVQVTRSPVCRPDSDCWDVEAYFFYPQRQVQTVRRVHRCTIDVSDVVPVAVGPVRSWFTR
jgi:hypothetical protein